MFFGSLNLLESLIVRNSTSVGFFEGSVSFRRPGGPRLASVARCPNPWSAMHNNHGCSVGGPLPLVVDSGVGAGLCFTIMAVSAHALIQPRGLVNAAYLPAYKLRFHRMVGPCGSLAHPSPLVEHRDTVCAVPHSCAYVFPSQLGLGLESWN